MEKDISSEQYTVLKPKLRPNTRKPTSSSARLMPSTSWPVEMSGSSALRITEMPLTPPVEKLLGNLKK